MGSNSRSFLVTVSGRIERKAISLPTLSMQVSGLNARTRPNGRECIRGQRHGGKAVIGTQQRDALRDGEAVDSIVAEGFRNDFERCGYQTMGSLEGAKEQKPRFDRTRIAQSPQ